jgi:NADPH-dependent F420 reductase
MNIAIFGTGNMASGLAAVFAKAGHQVTIAARDPAKARNAAAELGNGVAAATFADAAEASDAVFLAVPYDAAAGLVATAGGLKGKIVVDITNPMTADFSGLSIGHTTSAAEEIQKSAPAAKVVKAFNTIFASILQNGKAGGQTATVFVAGDDAEARKSVAELAASAGFRSVEVGGLAAARYLEPVAALNIALGYGLGHGTDIAPTWQGIA